MLHVILSVLLAASFSSDGFATLVAIQIFYFNIWVFWNYPGRRVFCNVKEVIWKTFYKEIKESVLSGLRITFLEHLEAQILKIYPLSANHGYFEFLTLFRMGLFGTAYGWEGQKAPLPTVCQTYPTIMKLGTVYLT